MTDGFRGIRRPGRVWMQPRWIERHESYALSFGRHAGGSGRRQRLAIVDGILTGQGFGVLRTFTTMDSKDTKRCRDLPLIPLCPSCLLCRVLFKGDEK